MPPPLAAPVREILVEDEFCAGPCHGDVRDGDALKRRGGPRGSQLLRRERREIVVKGNDGVLESLGLVHRRSSSFGKGPPRRFLRTGWIITRTFADAPVGAAQRVRC